ncbi:MAG: DUF2065 domain-containing protein [Methylophilaceae bacterium]
MDNILVVALGLMFIIEGLLPMLFPDVWRSTFIKVTQYKSGQIRFFGFLSIIFGIILFLFGKS